MPKLPPGHQQLYRDAHGLTAGVSQLRKQFAAIQSLDQSTAAAQTDAGGSGAAAESTGAGDTAHAGHEASAVGNAKHADSQRAAEKGLARRVQTVGEPGLGLQAKAPLAHGSSKSKRHRAL